MNRKNEGKMLKSHNKKRNIGIIYELMLRHVSACLVEGKNSDAQKCLDILQDRFSVGTEIYKEFRLFNALAKSTVSSTSVAAAILSEAKSAARRSDSKKLIKEKSRLIKDINYILNDDEFYKRRIPEYRTYGSIQTLLNSWRAHDESDLAKTVKHETQMVDHLLSEKDGPTQLSEIITPDADELIVKILTEKFNEKYRDSLNDSQKDIIKAYVFSIAESNDEMIKEMLSELKEGVMNKMLSLEQKTDNVTLLEKIEDVKKSLEKLTTDEINDSTMSKYLVVSQLSDIIGGEIDE